MLPDLLFVIESVCRRSFIYLAVSKGGHKVKKPDQSNESAWRYWLLRLSVQPSLSETNVSLLDVEKEVNDLAQLGPSSAKFCFTAATISIELADC